MTYEHNRSRPSGKKDASGTSDNRTDEFGSRRGSNQRTMTQKRAEQRFDCEFESAGEIRKVTRLEARFGQRVHNWIDEGMPIEAMGNPEQMEAYRMHKGTPIPWDIQRFNDRSQRRNTSRIMRRRRERPDGDTQVPESVRNVISSPGHSLEPSIQRTMEDRMGDSFSDVQVHTGPTAAAACEEINARAFTVGNHIAFNRGEYDPESVESQHVIAHELAHVRQQTGGAVSMLPQKNLKLEIDPDPQLEKEAEETAQRVMAGGELGIQRLADTAVHVQRATYGDDPYGDEHEEFIEKEKERLYGADEDEADSDAELSFDLQDALRDQLVGAVGGGALGFLKTYVDHGGLEQAANNPEALITIAGISIPGGILINTVRNLAKQLSAEEVRQVFIEMGKADLLDVILPTLGTDEDEEETGEGIDEDEYN